MEWIYDGMKIGVKHSIIAGFLILLAAFTEQAWAQTKPDISIVDKVTGSMGEVVTLRGNGFGTDDTKLVVTFGAATGQIISVTDQVLQVRVPAGATYDNISVTNITSGQTSYTREQFLLNYHGNTTPFAATDLESPQTDAGTTPVVPFPNAEGLYDLCMCDFNNDGKNDIAAAYSAKNYIKIFLNTTTGPGMAITWNLNTISLGSAVATLNIKCGDLDGDGKSDIAATVLNGDKLFVIRNTTPTGASSLTFAAPSATPLTGKSTTRVEIADLDLDGRPELIVTSKSTNTVSVLRNQSAPGNISFNVASPIDVAIPSDKGTDGLAVEDLNGDKLPEIVTGLYQDNSNIFIIENKSLPGSIAMNDITEISIGSTIKNFRIGDVDGDGKNDIVYTELGIITGIMLNESTTSSISFRSPQTLSADGTIWGLDLGDLDGNGKPEVVVASITKKSLTIFVNQSSPGNVSFQSVVKPTTYINRHVTIGDVDTDGKPDVAFTSIDNSDLVIPASRISVFRNIRCMVPVVTPPGPLNVCSGVPVELLATQGTGVTYKWKNLTTSTETSGSSQFSPTVSGNYVVEATYGGCVEQSSPAVSVTIGAGGPVADTQPKTSGTVCTGSSLTLSMDNPPANHTFRWTGPGGFSQPGASVTIADFNLSKAGTYYVEVFAPSGCLARKDSTIAKVVDMPDFKVVAPNTVLCGAAYQALSVSHNSPDFTYNWYQNNTALGQTGPTITIGGGSSSQSGEYYYTAESTLITCPAIQSNKVNMLVTAMPTASFTAQPSGTACRGQEVIFNNTSVTDPQAQASFTWEFGDGQTSTDEETTHIYNTVAVVSVKLTVRYDGSTACVATSAPFSLSITPAPPVTIINPEDGTLYDICPGETLQLQVKEDFPSYTWNTGQTEKTIAVTEPGTYSVEVKATNGCDLKATRIVGALPAPIVSATADPASIQEGESTQLTATGLNNYLWTPAESLSAPAIPNPMATPLSSTTYQVTGTDENGCTGTATVQVEVKGEPIVTKLTPSNFFSPNNDGSNPYWTIQKIDEYPQCGITIYDEKGVKVYNAKPYMNDWDGTFNGLKLPDGVYYYIIRCDGEENIPRSGSITLLR